MQRSNTPFVFGLTLVATLGGLLFGYDTAVISGAVKALETHFLAPLVQNTEQAHSVVFQYRITVTVVALLILYTLGSILVKLYGPKKGAVSALIVAVVIGVFICKPMKWFMKSICQLLKINVKI